MCIRDSLNIGHALAAVTGIGLFLLPYLGAALLPLPAGYTLPYHDLNGLELVIRENVVRFFQPFDHRDPVYSYLYHVPRLLLPWVFVFMAALVVALRHYRSASWQNRWLLEAILLVFLFFTLSGSRRWYYILPIMPFCTLLMADYLLHGPFGSLRSVALAATKVLLALLGLGLVASPLLLHWRGMPVTAAMWGMGAGLLLVLPLTWIMRTRIAAFSGNSQAGGQITGLVTVTLLLMWAVFTVVMPYTDSFRHDKSFALSLRQQLGEQDRVAFYQRERSDVVFYLEQDYIIRRLETLSPRVLDNTTLLIVEQRYIAEIEDAYPGLLADEPLLRQAGYEWQGKRRKSNLSAWRLADAAPASRQSPPDSMDSR